MNPFPQQTAGTSRTKPAPGTSRLAQRWTRDLQGLEPAVLFDIASEVATSLGGTYLWLAEHADQSWQKDKWLEADQALHVQLHALNPARSEDVIAALAEWTDLKRKLDEEHPV
jgi:hypothetical protein